MANIQLPQSFNNLLVKSQRLDGIVKQTLEDFGEILDANDLYFFPEYTDHGIRHIQDVLKCSEKFIQKNTYDLLSSDDATIYILSVILHDIGMHLSIEGFNLLLSGEYDDVKVDFFDDSTWAEVWQDYFSEAQRFSGRQLLDIFGDSDTIVRSPPLDKKGEMTENDRKLIGEFIRRNHPRLAHEIALKGYPSVQKIDFAKRLSQQVLDLIGLIARSHGLDLRKSVDYLRESYPFAYRTPHNCHAVFLMTLLRLSDYVQIDQTRSSTTVLRTKRLMSPISNMEHKAHEAIDFVTFEYLDDPEKIYVTASPENSSMYLKLKKLFSNIQYEFDISWAVLGETYGHIENKPNLIYRRIKSNLDESNFKEKLNYVPDEFKFRANDDIIRLLIAPLYGDDPKYGVRELLQNAIDACNERKRLDSDDYIPEVLVRVLDEENPYIEIIDNGIGMDINVLKNYFLSAGASYRKSYDWKQKFEDEKGQALIKRNGRFGIGALAGFLLGDSLEVTTRKFGNSMGYSFNVNLLSEQVDLIKKTKLNTGTTIKIKLKKDVNRKLLNGVNNRNNYDITWSEWFTLKSPNIKYEYMGKKLKNNYEYDPDVSEVIPINWGEIAAEGFERVLWTYSQKRTKNRVVCNGITIPSSTYEGELGLIGNKPKLNIFDLNGLLPISLNRNSLIGEVPFSKNLRIDIYKDFIANFLCLNNITVVSENQIVIGENDVEHQGIQGYWNDLGFNNFGYKDYNDEIKYERNLSNLLFSKKGYILNYCYFANMIGKYKFLLINLLTYVERLSIDVENYFIRISTSKINSIDDYNNALKLENRDFKNNKFWIIDSRIYMRTEKYEYLFAEDKKRVSQWLKSKSKVDSKQELWTIFSVGKPNIDNIGLQLMKPNVMNKLNFIRENLVECLNEGDKEFNELLERYIGLDVVIPYDLEERKKKYPLAFKELESYMQKYLQEE